jgi:hypothetical protein
MEDAPPILSRMDITAEAQKNAETIDGLEDLPANLETDLSVSVVFREVQKRHRFGLTRNRL